MERCLRCGHQQVRVKIGDKIWDVAYTQNSVTRGREHYLTDGGKVYRTCYAVGLGERVRVNGEVIEGVR